MSDFDRDAELERLSSIVDHYTAASRTERRANDYVARRAAELVRGPRVLLMGVAAGSWESILVERFGSFDAVDAAVEAVEQLRRRRGGSVRATVALFEEHEPEQRYDTIVMGHVLEHVHDPRLVLRRAGGWLAPAGELLILVPNGGSLHRAVGVQLGLLADGCDLSPADEALGHRRVYTRQRLRDDVEGAGLRCQQLGGLILKPLANSQMDSWSDELQDAFFALGDQHPELACVLLCVATRSA